MAERSDEPLITDYTIVVDTREQAPFSFTGHRADAKKRHRPLVVRTVIGTLKTGDYSLLGYEDRITIERKSLADAYSTFSQDRERFERELLRMAKFENSHIVIEADWPMLLSRRCPDCCGAGKVYNGPSADEDVIQFALNQGSLRRWLYQSVADFIGKLVLSDDWLKCERCGGTGKIHPTDHSKFSPKSFWRTVIAWKIRFPQVQWEFCFNRQFAEQTTLRLLERFWLDEQDRMKQ